MQYPPSSKELYLMNGGNTLYIYKDGFGDIYSATPEEEREWAAEVITRQLEKIEQETNTTNLKAAVETLVFHHYPGLDSLLIKKLDTTSIPRRIAFATCLWINEKYADSFRIVHGELLNHRGESLHEVFWGLQHFLHNGEARLFLVACLEGPDKELRQKARTCIGMWAYTGLPDLRNNRLLDLLETDDPSNLSEAIARVKKILS